MKRILVIGFVITLGCGGDVRPLIDVSLPPDAIGHPDPYWTEYGLQRSFLALRVGPDSGFDIAGADCTQPHVCQIPLAYSTSTGWVRITGYFDGRDTVVWAPPTDWASRPSPWVADGKSRYWLRVERAVGTQDIQLMISCSTPGCAPEGWGDFATF